MPGLGGTQYYILFTNKATSYTQYYIFKYKDKVYKSFSIQKIIVKNQLSYRVKIVRLNNGGEYIINSFKKLSRDSGIIQKLIVVCTPE